MNRSLIVVAALASRASGLAIVGTLYRWGYDGLSTSWGIGLAWLAAAFTALDMMIFFTAKRMDAQRKADEKRHAELVQTKAFAERGIPA